jgi:hypothetical protein
MQRNILGYFNKGVMDSIRKEMPELPHWIQFVSENEARVFANGIFCFKKTDIRLYFYYLGDEKHSHCIATVRSRSDMIAAIEGFMATFFYKI